jgi:hypothetical protein
VGTPKVETKEYPPSPINPYRVGWDAVDAEHAGMKIINTCFANQKFWDMLDSRQYFQSTRESVKYWQMLGMAIGNAAMQYDSYGFYSQHPLWVFTQRSN